MHIPHMKDQTRVILIIRCDFFIHCSLTRWWRNILDLLGNQPGIFESYIFRDIDYNTIRDIQTSEFIGEKIISAGESTQHSSYILSNFKEIAKIAITSVSYKSTVFNLNRRSEERRVGKECTSLACA